MLKEKTYGNLYVISGPSGSGKDTIVSRVAKDNKNVWVSVSATTREKRSNEKEGIDYYYLSTSEFEEAIKNDEFIEWASYNNNYYGTYKDKIVDKLNKGYDVILVIEIKGALTIKEKVDDAIFIFIMPPSMKELKSRLVKRKRDSQKEVLDRFKIAYKEINEYTKYNYVVVNDSIDKATNAVNAIILAEHFRVDRIEDIYLNSIEEEVHELLIDEEFLNLKRDL